MPSTDRYWRVYLGFGIVLIALAVALPLWFFASLLSIDGSLSAVLTQMDWSALLLVGIYGLTGVNAISMANRRRKRERLRERARAGDEAAMPLAGIKPQGVEPAALEREPIELLRLPERVSWFVVGTLLLLALMFTAVITAAATAVFLSSAWLVITCGAGVAALEVGLGVWLRTRRRTAPTGVVATDAGLRWIRGGKERAFIPWDEAQLLEFWHSDTTNWGSGFALSSDRALVEWRDYSLGEGPAAADGASSQVMYLRDQALLQTIIARTGLEPRECAPGPKRVEQSELLARNDNRSWRAILLGSAVLLFISAFPLAVAIGALLAPLTDSLAVNLYVTVTMGALGLALLRWFSRGLAELLQRTPTQPVQRLAIRLPDAPEIGPTPLTMRAVSSKCGTAIGAVVLLLIVGDLYALGRAFIYTVTTMSGPLPWWNLRSLTIASLALTSVITGIFAFIMVFSNAPRRYADEQGLRQVRWKKTVMIPWDMVAEVVITVLDGEVLTYKVIASYSQRTEIIWPPEVALDGVTPAPGESPGALFAAIVAQRAGVTPRVEYL